MFVRLASILSVFATAFASVTDCSNAKTLFKLTSMSFSPDPPVAGQNSTLLLSMKVPEEVTNGTVKYSTTYNFVPFAPTVEDLCDKTVPCPIASGALNTVSTYPFDNSLKGTVIFKIEWTELTGRSLLCVSLNLKLGDAAKQVIARIPARVRAQAQPQAQRSQKHNHTHTRDYTEL